MDKEEIFVVGFPRSGNTWVARLLGDALDSPVKARNNHKAIADEGFGRPGPYVIRQEHSDYKQFEKGEKVVLVVRDPRDTIVSAFHYWKIDTIEQAANCVIYGRWPTPQGSGWTYLYNEWLEHFDRVSTLIRYEDLHKDPRYHLGKMLKDLNVESPKNLQKVVNRQAFSTRKQGIKTQGRKLTYGPGVQNRALRKGVVGDWKEYFDNDLLEKMAEAKPHGISFASVAKEFGYNVHNN